MKQKRLPPRYVFAFDDGPGYVSAVEMERQWLRESILMTQSESAQLRASGKRRLEQAAQLLATARMQPFQAKVSAVAPRKVDADQRKKIVDFYLQRQRDGETRGAIKALTARFPDISETTLHTILKPHKVKSIRK